MDGKRVSMSFTSAIFSRAVPRYRRLHVTSSGPRTGSTLLAELIKASFVVDGTSAHEDSASVPNRDFCSKGLVLSKKPLEILPTLVGTYCDRNFHAVCIVRDPRDMVCSQHRGAPDRYYVSLAFWNYFYFFYKSLKARKRILIVKYEDLVTDPDGIQQQLITTFPFLQKKADFSEFNSGVAVSQASRLALHDVRPISSNSIGGWQEHKPRVRAQISIHGDPTDSLIALGYECDSSWLSKVDDLDTPRFTTVKGDCYSNDRRITEVKSAALVITNSICAFLGFSPAYPRAMYRWMKAGLGAFRISK